MYPMEFEPESGCYGFNKDGLFGRIIWRKIESHVVGTY